MFAIPNLDLCKKFKKADINKFQFFSQLICSLNQMKGLKIGEKNVKIFKFEQSWGELQANTCIQRVSSTKYFRQTLDFMENSAPREMFSI